jgi:hypothetical protein
MNPKMGRRKKMKELLKEDRFEFISNVNKEFINKCLFIYQMFIYII